MARIHNQNETYDEENYDGTQNFKNFSLDDDDGIDDDPLKDWDDEEVDEPKKGFKFVMNKKMAVVVIAGALGLLLTLVAGGVSVSKIIKKKSEPVDTTTTIDISETGVAEDENTEAFEEFVEDTKFKYTAEELEELRAYGYTADEIETNQAEEVSAVLLIRDAKNAYEQKQKELAKIYSSPKSKEYKSLENNTWVGLPKKKKLKSNNTITAVDNYLCTFTRIGRRGNQYFIKLKIQGLNTTAFTYVDNDTYNRLLRIKKSKGLVLCEIKRDTYKKDYIITDIKILAENE